MVKIYDDVTYHSAMNTEDNVITKGLYFELEIEGGAREMLSTPSKRATALLDVTFIKPMSPKKTRSVYKRILKGAEVKKIISTMNFDKQNIKKVIDSFIIETKDQCVGTDICRKSVSECLISIKNKKVKDQKIATAKKRSNSQEDLKEFIDEYLISVKKKKVEKQKITTAEKLSYSQENLKKFVDECLVPIKNKKVKVQKITTAKKRSSSQENLKEFVDECLVPIKNKKVKGQKLITAKKRSSSQENFGEFINESIKLLYASPEPFHEPSTLLLCSSKMAKSSNEKADVPHIRENCTSMNIGKDSQKTPFANEDLVSSRNKEKEGERDSERERRNKRNTKGEEHDHSERYIQLLHKVKELEERLKVHEETTVPKNEFKKRITRHKNEVKHCHKCCECCSNSFNSDPLLVTEKGPKSCRSREPRFCDKKTSPMTTSYPFWKRGEEFLKPGIDFKNRILLLIGNTFTKFSKGTGAVPEAKVLISVKKTEHRSNTSLTASYFNHGRWVEFDASSKL